MKCAVVLLFLGWAFYLRIETDSRRETFQHESVGAVPTEIFFVRMDINHARSEALETLPGIGRYLSNEIIRYRREHGFFKKPSDLLDVKGIGPKRLKQISPYLIFPCTTETPHRSVSTSLKGKKKSFCE